MPWTGVSPWFDSAATLPRHARPFLPLVEQHGTLPASGTFPGGIFPMAVVPPGHTHTACYELQLQGTVHKLAGNASPPHWAVLGAVGDQAQTLEHSSEQGDMCSCKGPPEAQDRAPFRTPSCTDPHLTHPTPSSGPQPWLCCLHAAWRRFRPHAWFPWQL